MKSMKFGECLKLLLSDLGISNNRLSKAINVDGSLVNRWINEKRIPSYNTAYIEIIAEYISKNIHNTYQKQQIDNLISEVCGTFENSISIKDQIQSMLAEAQGYSIECYQNEIRENKNKFTNNKQKTKKPLSFYTEDILSINNSISLSSKDKVIFGQKNIAQSSLSMLEIASTIKPQCDNTIYIAYDNDCYLDIYSENDLKNWINTLTKALNNGWNLVLLVRLTHDTDRMIRFMNFAKPLIQTGNFNPYYMKKYDSYVMGEELIIIPGVGALLCFSNNLHASINRAFYLSNPEAINMYLSHFIALMDKSAKSLIERYHGNIYYSNLLIKIEEAAGNRFLYRYCFGMMTIPEKLYLRLLKRKNITNAITEKSIELYKKRHKAFLFNIQRYQYWDIYISSCIKDLIKDHQIYFYSYYGVELMDVEVNDIIEHLENIINLLETYDNYHIAFHKCNADGSICTKNIYCLVKERQSVLFEIISPKNDLSEIRITSEEPMLINGFYEYFKNIWEHIPPINKNKAEVIRWIKYEIEMLNNENR
jgi:hypothetical protein